MDTNQKNKNNEIIMAITAIAVTATLGFWNGFSASDKTKVINNSLNVASLPLPEEVATEVVVSPTTQPNISFKPVKIIFNGVAPVQKIVQTTVIIKKPKNNNGNSNNNSSGNSQPPVTTGSSKP